VIKIYDINKKFDKPFEGEVRGLGEVYEVMAVERLRKKLVRIYGKGKLYLVPYSHKEFLPEIDGVVDCPPWESRLKDIGNKPSKIKVWLAKPIFWILIKYFEEAGIRVCEPHMAFMIKLEGAQNGQV